MGTNSDIDPAVSTVVVPLEQLPIVQRQADSEEAPITHAELNTGRLVELRAQLTCLAEKRHMQHGTDKPETGFPSVDNSSFVSKNVVQPATRPKLPYYSLHLNSNKRLKASASEAPKMSSGDSEARASVDLSNKKFVDKVKLLAGLVCIEICAGCAKLSQALGLVGFQTVAIDHSKNIHRPRVHCIHIDLANEGAFELINSLLEETSIFYVHLAPPCGTASAARSRPMSASQLAAGLPWPKPLRSALQPLGIDGLSADNQQGVTLANRIYMLCSKVVLKCVLLKIIVSLENPASSLFWKIWYIAALCSNPLLAEVFFHHCMLGGDRDKYTKWLGTAGVFDTMGLLCDGKHVHKPWSASMVAGVPVFDTALESEYQTVLCTTVAHLVRGKAIEAGYAPPADSLDGLLSQAQLQLQSRAAVGKQPRGRKLPQLVPEFLCVKEISLPVGTPLLLQKSQSLLRRFLRGKAGISGSKETLQIHIVGTRRSPEEFYSMAEKAGHPYKPGDGVTDQMKLVVHDILTLGPRGLQTKRSRALRLLLDRAKLLSNDETELHKGLPDHLKLVLAKKRILLFREMLLESKFPDFSVADELAHGFDVTG